MGRKQEGDTAANANKPATVQLLSVRCGDASPAVLVSSDTERCLINCGEGVQRLCVEHKIKISKVSRIALTDLSPDAVGGLPGLLLTSADMGVRQLTLHGPAGLRAFVGATRHFMRRDELALDLDECCGAAGGAAGGASTALRGGGILKVEAILLEEASDARAP